MCVCGGSRCCLINSIETHLLVIYFVDELVSIVSLICLFAVATACLVSLFSIDELILLVDRICVCGCGCCRCGVCDDERR